MTDQTKQLTNLDPRIRDFQDQLRASYDQQNRTVMPGQILFVGSSLMEIFPIEKFQAEQDLGLSKHIYNRGVRATTTADLLAHMDPLIFDLQPSKIFINIGSNDIGFNVPTATFLANYDQILTQIHAQLPATTVYLMAYYPLNTTADFGEEKGEHTQLYRYRSNAALVAADTQVQALAAKHGDAYINANAGLTDDHGDLRAELTFDGAHLLPAGFQIVLANLLPYLKS